jgi:hypothetical protein
MKHGVGLAILLILPFMLAGCGQKDPDTLYKEQIKCANELADAIENDSTQETIDEIAKRYKENYDKLVLLKLTDDDYYRLLKKYGAELRRYMNLSVKAKTKKPPIRLPDIPPLPIPGKM